MNNSTALRLGSLAASLRSRCVITGCEHSLYSAGKSKIRKGGVRFNRGSKIGRASASEYVEKARSLTKDRKVRTTREGA